MSTRDARRTSMASATTIDSSAGSPTLAPTVSGQSQPHSDELLKSERLADDADVEKSMKIADDEKPRGTGLDDEDDPTSAPVRLRTHESGFDGTGTPEDPFRVAFRPTDRDNPMAFKPLKRWTIVFTTAMSTLAISFASSAVTGGLPGIIAEFNCSVVVATLTISLFVLGFALGPLLWAPLSEMYGRRLSFAISYAPFVLLTLGSGFSKNIETLIVLRFLAGAFGSSPLTNSGGVISDMCATSRPTSAEPVGSRRVNEGAP